MKLNKKIVLLFILLLIISTILIILNANSKIKVKRILKEEYSDIKCLDNECNKVIAYKESKKGKKEIILLNNKNNNLTKYKFEDNNLNTPIGMGDNFYIVKNVEKNTVYNKKNKKIYETPNNLILLNDNLILEKNGDNDYILVNKKGKKIFEKVKSYDLYNNGLIISIDVDGKKYILNENGKILYSDYYVIREVLNEKDETLYLIIRNNDNNQYNFFNIHKNKIIGESFVNYSKKDDNTLIVSKKDTDEMIHISLDGKQKKVKKNELSSKDIYNKIDKEKYKVYELSIDESVSKYVFVDNLDNKSFGIYNIDKNKYEKIYDYNDDSTSIYSNINLLKSSDDKKYYQISCSMDACGDNKFVVYDIENNNIIYFSESNENVIQKFYYYSNNYKIVKYSYSSKEDEVKGKYVLLDKENKELFKSVNSIVIIDEKLLIGDTQTSSIILYSTKNKKTLNDEKFLANKISLDNKIFYKYYDDNQVIIVNEKGKNVLSTKTKVDLIISDKLIMYNDNYILNIFNASNSKIKKYKMNNGENFYTLLNKNMKPYKNIIFINNTEDSYFKVINSSGKTINKIKNSNIYSVNYTNDKSAVIISKNKNNLYGLYIVK